MSTTYSLRAAAPHDVPAIVDMITELAEFEHLAHQLQLTPARLHSHLFGARPVVEAVVAELAQADGGGLGSAPTVVAYALFFTNFSTFLGQPGLYLEDLYVRPAQRGRGIGQALLRHLGALAVARDYGRFEWTVLDWNANAIRLYEKMGATVMPEWRICRVTGAQLAGFAATDLPAA